MSNTKSKAAAAPLTVAEFAAREGVTKGRVRQWIGEGRLPVVGENPYLIAPETAKPAAQKRGRRANPPEKAGKTAVSGKSRKSS